MIRPLTKRDKTGNLYVRPHQVETQINTILTQNLSTLRNWLAVADHQAPDYLRSESLVHLIRDARRNSNDAIFNTVLPVLLVRCEAILLAKIPDNKLPNAADIREEVLGQFSELFAIDGTKEDQGDLDYFECCFNHAFRTFRIDLVRRELTYQQHFVPLDQADEVQSDSLHPRFSNIQEALQIPATQESTVLKKELLNALNSLPPNEREAVVLHYLMDYDVESIDPKKRTVATICGVTGRTIRNRLSRAVAKLSKNYKEEL